MKSKTLCATLAMTGLLLAFAPAAEAQSRRGFYERDGAFRVHLGAFRPEGESEYWELNELEFTGGADDLENISFGVDYLLTLNQRFGILFSGTGYSGDTTQSYLGFTDNFGGRIRHDTTLDIGSGTVGLVLHPLGADAPISPYVGAGAGAYFWNLREEGDFIDLDNDNEIFFAEYQDEGVTFGYYLQAGLEAPITPRLSLFAEGRWDQAEDELSDDFEGFGDLDLSGRSYRFGVSFNL